MSKKKARPRKVLPAEKPRDPAKMEKYIDLQKRIDNLQVKLVEVKAAEREIMKSIRNLLQEREQLGL